MKIHNTLRKRLGQLMQNQAKNRTNNREDISSGDLGSTNLFSTKAWTFFSLGIFKGILIILRILYIYKAKKL
jgi:hypothetical protein